MSVHLSSCSMSLTLYMVMSEVAAAGMMMMGVREGRLAPTGARAAAAGSSCRAGVLAAGPFSEHIQFIYLSEVVIRTEYGNHKEILR